MVKAGAATLPHFLASRPSADPLGFRFLGEPAPVGQPPPRSRASEIDGARREAVLEAQAVFERQRAEDRAAHQRALAEHEARVLAGVAGVLADQLEAGLVAIEQTVASEVARALQKFLAGAVRERALSELADTLKALLSRRGAEIHIAGPEALVLVLQQRFKSDNAVAHVTVAPGASEVTVRFNETEIRTAIGGWGARLAVTDGEGAGV